MRIPLFVLISSLAAILACNGVQTATPFFQNTGSKGEESASTVAERQAKYREAIAAYVNKNAATLAQYALRAAEQHGQSTGILKLLEAASPKQSTQLSEALSLPPLSELESLKALYAAHHDHPIFFSAQSLRPAAEPLIAELKRLPSHGLGPQHIDAKLWLSLLSEFERAQAQEPFVFDETEKAYLVDRLIGEAIDVKDNQAVARWIEAEFESSEALSRLREEYARQELEALAAGQRLLAVDLLSSELALRFARSLRFDNEKWWSAETRAELKSDSARAQHAQTQARLWLERLSEAIQRDDKAAVQAEVQSLFPIQAQYRELMAARERYLGLEDWTELKASRLTPGKSAEGVPALRERLAKEGFLDLNAVDLAEPKLYDSVLEAAVKRYHETHQLDYDPSKGLQKGFWTSLNTPRTTRLAQIEENLRRWHKTQLFPSEHYIFINIPDFHGELWHKGELVHRFPVVVGNAKRVCSSATKRWQYINATPIMHARMHYLEYNPYWNVPPRIEQEDYIEKINADPSWLSQKGFEYYTENGRTILRQLPSENNALGRVKFIFPNSDSVFMHDSPQKGLFRYPVRAFSHGCMRVWRPLDLARVILELDGQWRDSIETEIEDMKPKRFNLKNRFDVFVDYYTVKVDPEGYVNFLADPYRFVRDALDPPSLASQSCKPNPRAWVPRQALDGGVGADLGADSIPVDPS